MEKIDETITSKMADVDPHQLFDIMVGSIINRMLFGEVLDGVSPLPFSNKEIRKSQMSSWKKRGKLTVLLKISPSWISSSNESLSLNFQF